jgi:hypothetical protein
LRPVAILALLLTAGCGGDYRYGRVWSGSKAVVLNADKVEASLLVVPDGPSGKPGELDYWSWPRKGAPVALDAAAAQRVKDLLLDEASYYRGPPKKCLPMPGVQLRFERGTSAVSVLLCLECRILAVRGPDGHVGMDDFDPAAPALLAIVQKLFPGDPVIRRLR